MERVPDPGGGSSRQACWYIRCIRRVSETPEKSRRRPLKTPTDAAAGMREQLLHRSRRHPGELEPADEPLRDDVAVVRRRQGGREQDERDERGEGLRREDQRPVDALQRRGTTGRSGRGTSPPAGGRTRGARRAVSVPLLPLRRAGAYDPPASAVIRPDAIASTSDRWSRSFWSA